jgi:hypothetical protein
MTENIAMLNGRDFPAIEVEIRTTNCSSRHPEDDVVAIHNGWIGNSVDFDAVRAVIGQCSHNVLLLLIKDGMWESNAANGKFKT